MLRQLFGTLTLATLLSFLTLGSPARAAQGVHIVTDTTAISTAFATTYPGLALTQVNPVNKHAWFSNGCTVALAMTVTNSSAAVAPSSSLVTNPQQVFLPPQSSIQLQGFATGKYIWLRTDTSSAGSAMCSKGDVTLNFY
jgi:anti-sigma factor ChrR (cupin superfamily)